MSRLEQYTYSNQLVTRAARWVLDLDGRRASTLA